MYVLCYHRVIPDDGAPEHIPYFLRGTAVSVASFASQVADAKRRFECVNEMQALAYLRGEISFDRPPCWFTFDDAYSDSLEFAAPILREHGVPATMFVSTGVLGGQALAADRWYAVLTSAETPVDVVSHVDSDAKRRYLRSSETDREETLSDLAQQLRATRTTPAPGLYLDADGVRSLVERGWSIGSHSISHPILTEVDQETQRVELVESLATLRLLCGRSPRTFSYPDGAWDEAIAQRVQEAGYRAALTLIPEPAEPGVDLFQIPRLLARDDAAFVRKL